MDEKTIQRIKKLQALAERGVGGEKTTAQKKLAKLLMNARHYGESCRKLKEIGVILGELIEEVKTRK